MRELLYITLLLAASVTMHAVVITWLSRRVRVWPAVASGSFVRATLRMVQIAWWLVLGHVAQITLWAAAYSHVGAVSDPLTAGYFSLVTYTTVGYGDVVPAPEWRLLAGVEALTGILMCGWSAAFFFSVVSRRLLSPHEGASTPPE